MKIDITRFFDILFSFIGLIILSPVFLILIILIKLDSRGHALFLQQRVGINDRDFILIKFRTMKINAEKERSITINNDDRITRIGAYLRRYKLDELPQLWNVLIGDMSFVGPRPELRKYVNFYDKDQRKVLNIRPGITDFASIKFKNENELLTCEKNAEAYYVQKVIPIKIKLNQQYIKHKSVGLYFLIIFKTLFSRC